ncbi:MAG: universal stress protein [Burkholderiaceae bacterium]|jgi:nucleotide-binding universal stress UspA family protein|nr:universal stress protein [Burkholderiaceae bacterium]
MRIQTIAALTDFSTQAEQALDRAALLAAQHQAHLVLVYAAEELNPRFVNPQARLEQRARQLARRHEITVNTRDFDEISDVADRALAAAAVADLLVMDRRMERAWSRPWRGSTLAHCLRMSPCPVLVVQQPVLDVEDLSAHYARMVVAVDGTGRSREVLQYAANLQTVAAVDLFQAEGGVQQELEQYRDELQEEADDRRLRIKDAFDARRNRVDSHTGARDVTRQLMVQQQRSGADLIVIGTPRHHWMDRWALSARGARLAGLVSCDVLVCGQLPQDRKDLEMPDLRGDSRLPQFKF